MIRSDIKERGFAVAVRSLQTLDQNVIAAAARGLDSGLLSTVRVVQREFLSGPRPAKLDVRSTRLRNSIERQVAIGKKGVVGRIGTNIPYGAFHEFGFSGKINVRAHTRITSVQDDWGATQERRQRFDASGRAIGFRDTFKAVARRQKEGVAHVQFVKAHTRPVNYAGRPFVRPALEKSLPVIKREIESELGKL